MIDNIKSLVFLSFFRLYWRTFLLIHEIPISREKLPKNVRNEAYNEKPKESEIEKENRSFDKTKHDMHQPAIVSTRSSPARTH